ncbi:MULTISPECIES: SNF2-related protein [unclassified Thiocapsa]|uniref:SNF2-related protein n=1 Tax=unclassified Thiocapsa TaxID=2641286 RepID=UPI0035B32E2B
MSFSWTRAATALQKLVAEDAAKPREEQDLDDGQRASLAWMAKRLAQSGLVLADEVGTGKTRIACAVVHAVLDAGGRAAVVVPHGLMHQWLAESRKLRTSAPPPKELTTFTGFLREASATDASPWVLIAQSQVGREGLNLHESCRVVVQFHAEWNPAVLEQQIGRVDRKGSLWERLARKWIEDGKQGEPPFVEVRQLVLEGTYDAFQWDRVKSRQHVFDASLFGSLLPANAWDRVPKDRLKELNACAPRFNP